MAANRAAGLAAVDGGGGILRLEVLHRLLDRRQFGAGILGRNVDALEDLLGADQA